MPPSRRGTNAEISERLATAQSTRGDRISEVHYLGGDGEVLASSADGAVGENFFETAGVEGANDGPSAAHDAVASDESVLSFVAAVDGGSDRYVAVSAPVSAFGSTLETADDRRTIVTDANGEPIASVGEAATVGDDAVLAAASPDGDGVATGTPRTPTRSSRPRRRRSTPTANR